MSMRYKSEIVVNSARIIRREIAGPTKTGRRRIQTGRQEIRAGYQFPYITLEKKAKYQVIAEVRSRTQGEEMSSKIKEADKRRK